jgi:hypothetical protein
MEEGKGILPQWCTPFIGSKARARSWAHAKPTPSLTMTWCGDTYGMCRMALIPYARVSLGG